MVGRGLGANLWCDASGAMCLPISAPTPPAPQTREQMTVPGAWTPSSAFLDYSSPYVWDTPAPSNDWTSQMPTWLLPAVAGVLVLVLLMGGRR